MIKPVKSKTALKYDLEQSTKLGRDINSDAMTNPVGSLEDYYDFVDALLTYTPQNLKTDTMSGAIRVAMDGANYCNWNILDLLSYSYGVCQRSCPSISCGVSDFRGAGFGFGVQPYWSGGLPVSGFT